MAANHGENLIVPAGETSLPDVATWSFKNWRKLADARGFWGGNYGMV